MCMRFATFTLFEQRGGLRAKDVYRRAVEQAVLADEPGFETTWLAEHPFTDYGVVPSPAVIGASIAERTARLTRRPSRSPCSPFRTGRQGGSTRRTDSRPNNSPTSTTASSETLFTLAARLWSAKRETHDA
jgi:hypothetical protein